jgi:predicted 2-oxoglutarate/Fe(II)-dependent dioxygenase YbiX
MSIDRLLSDCVVAVPNVLPDDTIDRLLRTYQPSERWKPARIAMGVLNRNERCCDVIDIVSSPQAEFKEPDGWTEEVLRAAVQMAYVRYREAFPKAVVGQDYGYKLLRYERNGFYEEHIDEAGSTGRILSCPIILNDDFTGGEMAWFDGSLVMKPTRGTAIMFPSGFLFPHAVLPVRSGVRYSAVTWLG